RLAAHPRAVLLGEDRARPEQATLRAFNVSSPARRMTFLDNNQWRGRQVKTAMRIAMFATEWAFAQRPRACGCAAKSKPQWPCHGNYGCRKAPQTEYADRNLHLPAYSAS